MKEERNTVVHKLDEKDMDYEFSKEPNQYHTIKCKDCNKKAEVSKRYTRKCDRCRLNTRTISENNMDTWQAWGYHNYF